MYVWWYSGIDFIAVLLVARIIRSIIFLVNSNAQCSGAQCCLTIISLIDHWIASNILFRSFFPAMKKQFSFVSIDYCYLSPSPLLWMNSGLFLHVREKKVHHVSKSKFTQICGLAAILIRNATMMVQKTRSNPTLLEHFFLRNGKGEASCCS